MKLPQGLSRRKYKEISRLIRGQVGIYGDDIAVHGSRASYTAKYTSGVDIAIRVSTDMFDDIVKARFKTPNSGSAKIRTMRHAVKTGKIQSGEAGLRGLRKALEKILGMDVDISIIKKVENLIKIPISTFTRVGVHNDKI